jgi:hypothetical protein
MMAEGVQAWFPSDAEYLASHSNLKINICERYE